MAKKTATESADRFMLRMPPGMRERIAEQAALAGRSINAEIVARLERTLAEQNVTDWLEAHDAQLDEHENELRGHDNRLDKIEEALEFIRSHYTRN